MYFNQITAQLSHLHADELVALLHDPRYQGWSKQGLYDEHQWLWTFFPDVAAGERPFLFRRTLLSDADLIAFDLAKTCYYVVSSQVPVSPNALWRVQSKPYAPVINEGDVFAFDVRVNPIVTRNKKRFDVVMDAKTQLAKQHGFASWKAMGKHKPDQPLYDFAYEASLKWMTERSDCNGFRLINDSFGVESYRSPTNSQRYKQSAKEPLISTIDLNGRLQVTDVEKFTLLLQLGLGPAKAFGCGLVMIRRDG